MLQLDKPTPFMFRHVKKVDIYKESRPVSDVGKQVDNYDYINFKVVMNIKNVFNTFTVYLLKI